jgi:hypothetical protein
MCVHRTLVQSVVLAGVALLVVVAVGAAQAQVRREAKPATPASLNQLMRAVLFVNSNVIFAAQDADPAAMKPDAQSSTSTNPLTGIYGGWQAVENSSLALAEAGTLLTIPGRLCANGKPAPTGNADWATFVQGLRDAGMASYKAAQSRNQDAILEAADRIVTACANCHEVYRDKGALGGQLAARCVK